MSYHVQIHLFPIIWFAIVLYMNLTCAAPVEQEPALDLIILHNNDMHARFEQTDRTSAKCKEVDAEAKKCYGGFARVSSVVKKYRREAENGGPAVLFLNAGDTYIGTPWFSIFKHKVSSDFMNILKPDAMVHSQSINFVFGFFSHSLFFFSIFSRWAIMNLI